LRSDSTVPCKTDAVHLEHLNATQEAEIWQNLEHDFSQRLRSHLRGVRPDAGRQEMTHRPAHKMEERATD